jgi:DNA invertase Pin-like site-specific DNA recombinase
MLDRIAGNGVRTIIVESPDRFARDVAVQLAGHDHLRKLGVTLIPATAPDFFTEDTPTAVLVRQVLGAIAQFDKATSVAKLKAARDRKIAAGEKCGGRKSYAEARPEMVELARQLRRPDPDRRPISLRCFCRTRLCRVNRQAIRSCGHRVYRTDASHDLARRQMPVTDQPLAAVSVSLSA